MKNWNTYQENTSNNHIGEEEKTDGRNYRIESETDYDILNYSEFEMELIDGTKSDGHTVTIEIYGKSTNEIIELINNL